MVDEQLSQQEKSLLDQKCTPIASLRRALGKLTENIILTSTHLGVHNWRVHFSEAICLKAGEIDGFSAEFALSRRTTAVKGQ
jgi:hypothetical protein